MRGQNYVQKNANGCIYGSGVALAHGPQPSTQGRTWASILRASPTLGVTGKGGGTSSSTVSAGLRRSAPRSLGGGPEGLWDTAVMLKLLLRNHGKALIC